MKRISYAFLILVLISSIAGPALAEEAETPAQQKIAAARKAIEQNPERYDAHNQLALAQARRA